MSTFFCLQITNAKQAEYLLLRFCHIKTDLLYLGPEMINNWTVLHAKKEHDISRGDVSRWGKGMLEYKAENFFTGNSAAVESWCWLDQAGKSVFQKFLL